MHPLFPHQLSISWNVTVLDVTPDGLVSPCCQKCQTQLDIHQPDEGSPDRLLGTCRDCGSWHMIEIVPGGTEALLFDMPGVDFVRRTLAESREGRVDSSAVGGGRGLVNAGVNGRHT